MPITREALRYPAKRVLLARTRLAYVHLRNLLTDAMRDRTARVCGYVVVWLPDELITLFLEEGEVVNATTSSDGERFQEIAISDAIGRVPSSAEYGSICFHEALAEQLDTMFVTQTGMPLPWPHEIKLDDGDALLAFLYATMHDGVIELVDDSVVHYVAVSSGSPIRGYFADTQSGDVVAHLKMLLAPRGAAPPPVVRLWPRAEALPAQASPALIQAYRDLIVGLTTHLGASGAVNAAEIVEDARRPLVATHPLLERFAPTMPTVRDPVSDTLTLSNAIADWLGAVLRERAASGFAPEQVLREIVAARRHLFQAAGLFDALPWKLQW